MKYQAILQQTEQFLSLAQNTINQSVAPEVSLQHDRLFKFHEHLSKTLLRIISELGSEISTLKDRTFDSKMLGLLSKTYQGLINIYKHITENDPYLAAQELIRLVLEKPNAAVIDNLDFLAKHHLQSTNESLRTGKLLQHPQINSLDKLKELANYCKTFIGKYPMLSNVPAKQLMESNTNTGREDITQT